MYSVHMKRIGATEARRTWFRLLDEVAAGEIVVVERGGRRIVLRREEPPSAGRGKTPSYEGLLLVRGAEHADEWGWEWTGPGRDVEPAVAEEP
jgi:hypothetical protein